MVDGVSRLRCQGGVFWLWEGGTYQRQSDAAITKLVSDFLDGSKLGGGDMFNPKRNDVAEVLSALRVEAFLEDRFVAPCWLPGGEPATEWIVCRNGVVNVRTGEVKAHSHRLWAHGTLDWDWLPEAKCPVFDGFLESIFPGDPDAQACLVEAIGYSMTLDVRAQKGFLLLGASRAGKGTIIRLVSRLVGSEEAMSTSFDQWLKSDLSPYLLIGKRVVAFPDTRLKKGQQYGANYDAGGLPAPSKEMLLRITGGDGQTLRKTHSQEAWTGVLTGKVWIASNDTPNFNDPILPTRFIKLWFGINQDEAGNLDPFLEDKLAMERPGIAAKALRGYQRVAARMGEKQPAFVQPESGLRLVKDLETAQLHPHRAMVMECFELSSSERAEDWVAKPVALEACKAWLRENNKDGLAAQLRSQAMGEHLANVFAHLRQLTPANRDKQLSASHGSQRVWLKLCLSPKGRALLGDDESAALLGNT
jgi:putative DNA primase/helicase